MVIFSYKYEQKEDNFLNENTKQTEEIDASLRLSIERTILSNTRTYSAWVRTGLSLVLAGFGIVKFMGNNDKYQAFVSSIGILFVVLGLGVYIFGYYSYKISYQRLEKEERKSSAQLRPQFLLTLGLVTSAILVIILLVLFR